MNPLKRRWTGPEALEGPASTDADLRRALSDFARINLLISGTRGLLRDELVPRMRRLDSRPVSVLDIGAGGCDIARWLALYCRRDGIPVRIICLDSDPRAVAFGRAACAAVPEIDVRLGNAFDLETAAGPVDFIIANHFLHHIDDERIPCLLASMDRTARHGFIVSDLRRSCWAYVAFAAIGALLWPRGMTRSDGLVSIRKGFTLEELADLLQRAGLAVGAAIWTRFPARVCVACFK